MDHSQRQFQDEDELVRVGDEEQDAGEDAIHLSPADIEVNQQALNDSLKNSETSNAENAKSRGQRKLVPITAGKNNFESDTYDIKEASIEIDMQRESDSKSRREAQVAQLNDYLESEMMDDGADSR